MSSTPSIAKIAALVSNSGRANVLLSCSMALTTTELAFAAHVSPQTTSGHLANMTERQGWHSYYRLASPLIGRMLEAIMVVAANGAPRRQPQQKGDERRCGRRGPATTLPAGSASAGASSSKWCQSRPFRASLEASKHRTAPTLPAHSHATRRSNPGRATVPLADRPKSSSITSTSMNPR
jgi:hypothetical protein